MITSRQTFGFMGSRLVNWQSGCAAWLVAGLAVFAIGIAGCGNDRPKTVPVRGAVTFDGAAPPAAGALYFAPISVAEGYPRRPGRADFDVAGRYEVTSFDDGDGLVPGVYRVTIECWETLPEMDKPGVSYVADDFLPAELRVDVDAGSVKHDIDVRRKSAAR